MSRDRFFQLLSNLHISDNTIISEDKLQKLKYRTALVHEPVQPFLDKSAGENNNRGRPSLLPEESRLQGKHFTVSRYPYEKKCCTVFRTDSENMLIHIL